MSDTIVDMPKVTQMLDAGWRVLVFRNGIGDYSAEAIHRNEKIMSGVRGKMVAGMSEYKNFLKETNMTAEEAVDLQDFDDGYLMTSDFTPEQALTRLAYKVHGEII